MATFHEEEENVMVISRPVLLGIMSSMMLICAVGAVYVGPVEWGTPRLIFSGLFTGFASFFMLFINRLLIS